LVLFRTCPTCEDEEIFFYDSLGDASARYRSYAKGHDLASDELLPLFERHALIGGS